MAIVSRTPKHFNNSNEPWYECWAERGRLYPQSQMTEYQGHWYCKDHVQTKYQKERQFLTPNIEEDPDANGSDFTAVIPTTFGNTDRT